MKEQTQTSTAPEDLALPPSLPKDLLIWDNERHSTRYAHGIHKVCDSSQWLKDRHLISSLKSIIKRHLISLMVTQFTAWLCSATII